MRKRSSTKSLGMRARHSVELLSSRWDRPRKTRVAPDVGGRRPGPNPWLVALGTVSRSKRVTIDPRCETYIASSKPNVRPSG
jgi:hypothetical protein